MGVCIIEVIIAQNGGIVKGFWGIWRGKGRKDWGRREMGGKLWVVGMFRLAQTLVGSDALVAPPRGTYLYVSGVEAEKYI